MIVLEEAPVAMQAQIVELTVGHSFDNSGFIRDEMVLTPRKARVVYGDHFDVEDGRLVGYDKPRGTGERTKLVDGKGEPLGFEEAMRKIVEIDPDRDNLLKSKLKQGADSADKKPAVVEVALSKKPEPKGISKIEAALATKPLT